MLNTRSNTYSRGNRYRGDTSVAYWQYSIDELALLDLPAQIDFILKFTGKPSLATVGHSQGCTLPLMLLSAKPEYNAKVWLMMQIGAVTHAEEIQAKYMRHQAELRSAQKVGHSPPRLTACFELKTERASTRSWMFGGGSAQANAAALRAHASRAPLLPYAPAAATPAPLLAPLCMHH
jgi:predicted alpha/beta hydrolase